MKNNIEKNITAYALYSDFALLIDIKNIAIRKINTNTEIFNIININ